LLILQTETDYDELVTGALMEYMHMKKIDEVYLMGHSFGAFHALNLAHR
jgi:pimeloyl-ACP methyl ester carboxylesterase